MPPADAADAFRAVCGSDFDRLPQVVQRAHDGCRRLRGEVQVERGGWFSNLLADMLSLPAAARSVQMVVESEHLPDRMVWRRRFGERVFQSCFRREGAYLTEGVGPFRLTLRLEVAGAQLHYRLVRVRIFGLPWPAGLAPRLEAWEVPPARATPSLSTSDCRWLGDWSATAERSRSTARFSTQYSQAGSSP